MTYKNTQVLTGFSIIMAAAVLAAAAASLPSQAAADNGSKAMKLDNGLSVSIGTNGNVLVRGAEVEKVSGGVVTARTAWGDTDISWRVQTDSDTDILTKSGSNSSFADVTVGDEISFSGSLDSNDGSFAVDASVLKNWSEDDEDDKPQGNAWGSWKKWGDKVSNSFSFWHK